MNNKALINSFVWPGLPFCARTQKSITHQTHKKILRPSRLWLDFFTVNFFNFFTANG